MNEDVFIVTRNVLLFLIFLALCSLYVNWSDVKDWVKRKFKRRPRNKYLDPRQKPLK